jgi:hypothetical protein
MEEMVPDHGQGFEWSTNDDYHDFWFHNRIKETWSDTRIHESTSELIQDGPVRAVIESYTGGWYEYSYLYPDQVLVNYTTIPETARLSVKISPGGDGIDSTDHVMIPNGTIYNLTTGTHIDVLNEDLSPEWLVAYDDEYPEYFYLVHLQDDGWNEKIEDHGTYGRINLVFGLDTDTSPPAYSMMDTVPQTFVYGFEDTIEEAARRANSALNLVQVDLLGHERLGQIRNFKELFEENYVNVVYPSDEPGKPLVSYPALLSDWTASGIIFPRLGNFTEGMDTNPVLVNQTTGEPLAAQGESVVTFGGPDVNLVTYWAEESGNAPIIFVPEEDRFYFKHINGTSIEGADLPLSVINFDQDMFLIEVFMDERGRNFMICQGFGWKGTYAAGKYFDRVIYPDMNSYSCNWVIVKWNDTNGDGFVNAPGDGDTYTLIASDIPSTTELLVNGGFEDGSMEGWVKENGEEWWWNAQPGDGCPYEGSYNVYTNPYDHGDPTAYQVLNISTPDFRLRFAVLPHESYSPGEEYHPRIVTVAAYNSSDHVIVDQEGRNVELTYVLVGDYTGDGYQLDFNLSVRPVAEENYDYFDRDFMTDYITAGGTPTDFNNASYLKLSFQALNGGGGTTWDAFSVLVNNNLMTTDNKSRK